MQFKTLNGNLQYKKQKRLLRILKIKKTRKNSKTSKNHMYVSKTESKVKNVWLICFTSRLHVTKLCF